MRLLRCAVCKRPITGTVVTSGKVDGDVCSIACLEELEGARTNTQ